MIREKAKAKINLTLDVLFKRADGYHEVEMVMQTVDLSDQLLLEERDDNQIVLSCGVPYIPLDNRNLAYKAAALLRERYGIRKGIHITIDKQIPVAAGLAGGSSDGAAALRGLNRLWNLGLTLEELAELGAELGSDVPFCIYGGTAIARGRGEIIERLPAAPPLWVVLVKPPITVSTADVYGNLKVDEIDSHPDTLGMIQALASGNPERIVSGLGNVLEQVTFKMHPEVERLKSQIVKFGAMGALMSGSGPTVFGITDRESRAQRIYNALRGFSKEVYLTRFL
ncbi:4-(cytidine 5'-diphospho)-2-C-methyl-D-erythritol kinase [Effusibacillus lacus]|uniref:4-diphosphocytidyl-2-C-methyl-D-erythritol kinase n=1 Tax=Effusibacillus lacus TaxID=1348429 RepID=A0A292YIT5_9BACL|nr:4-(cytidine 5'-diphospho)-2-C-methyl-D-erythritol kinase [Effusibacillus lacus]TCS74453.1 4-diphosphocytidyl-2-C-methyl-D-erythritol kinase [Effusibacillus lacus]GAX88673.1 4-(cytidine 5'-diphospho)-2-C-methyl-D-erythritol kinase [Effusibacillus lacus]